MEISQAKRKILDVALDLFSMNGYEATSMSQIADELGIKKSSLYSHFKSKQEIFDVIMDESEKEYISHSIFSAHSFEENGACSKLIDMSTEELTDKVRRQVEYVTHDPVMSKIRKLLTIEQYRNPNLARAQEKRSYSDILNYYKAMMEYLIKNGILIDGDPEIMALEFISPISMQIFRIDRDKDCESEAMWLIEKHILSFSNLYRRKRP